MGISRIQISGLVSAVLLASASFASHADLYEDGLVAYYNGDYSNAAKYLSEAAGNGDSAASQLLSKMHSEGKLEISAARAFEVTKAAANDGIASSQYDLAVMLLEGKGTAIDSKAAYKWFARAAEGNYHPAYYRMAKMHELGLGVQKDQEKASRLYNVAASELDVFAQMGDAQSQNQLAMMYENAQGVIRNYALAFSWYKRAADQGHAEAQYNVGRMFAMGFGVDKSELEASLWFRLSADQGNSKARETLKKINEEGFGSVASLY